MPDIPEPTLRPPPRWPQHVLLAWVLAAIGLGSLTTSGVLALTAWTAGPGVAPVGVVPSAQPVLSASPQPAASSTPWDQPATTIPTRLSVPALGIDAPVVPVTVLPNDDLAIPDNPHVLGWWYDGASPGSHNGTVVIAGHVDTVRDGAGALLPLSNALPGQRIVLDTDQGPQDYVITALRSYPKSDLPAQVFATTGRARLVLITCGGAYNARTQQYADNVVVYALPY